MFKHLDKGQTTKVKDAMFLVDKNPGDVIIKEGNCNSNIAIAVACHILYCLWALCVYFKAQGRSMRDLVVSSHIVYAATQ
jgi:hypothetical protein